MKNTENKDKNEEIGLNKLKKIKSEFFIQIIFEQIEKVRLFKIIKVNRNIQQKLKINIDTYKEYSVTHSTIKLEIVPVPNSIGKFINIKKDEGKYFHIYFNDNKEEINRTKLKSEDKVSKINWLSSSFIW